MPCVTTPAERDVWIRIAGECVHAARSVVNLRSRNSRIERLDILDRAINECGARVDNRVKVGFDDLVVERDAPAGNLPVT